MFKTAALNCKEYKDLCEKEDIRGELPIFKVYPPLPAPAFIYEVILNIYKLINYKKGKIETNAITSALGRYVGSKVVEVNNNNVDQFISDKHNIPKCLLFTEKQGNPLIYKALSVAFDKKIDFGIVRATETAIATRYKIKKFPTIIVLSAGDRKPKLYEDKVHYQTLFDFLNVFSETFFRVGEEKIKPSDSTKAEKPWNHDVCIINFI
jgi:hypothetical protein